MTARKLVLVLALASVLWGPGAARGDDALEGLLESSQAAFDAARYADGLKTAEEALAKARAAADAAGEMRALLLAGRCHFRRSAFDLARPLFVEAQAIGQRLTRVEESDAWRLMGDVDNAQGRQEDARSAYERALAVAETGADLVRQAFAVRQLGWIHDRRSEYAQARSLYERSLALAEQSGDDAQIGLTESLIGLLEGSQGRLDEAETRLGRSIALLQRAGSAHGVAAQRVNLGILRYHRGQYREALQDFREARAFWEGAGDRRLAALTLDNEGAALAHLGRYEAAILAHRQAYEARAALGDQDGAAEALNNLATTEHSRGNLAGALAAYLQALEIHERAGRKSHVGVVLGNLARVYRDQGRPDLAEDYARRAVATLEAADEPLYLAEAWLRLAGLRLAAGAVDECEALSRKALALAEQRGLGPNAAEAHSWLGRAASARGRLDEARREHLAAREAYTGQGARMLAAEEDLELARLSGRGGDWAAAAQGALAVAALAESESVRSLVLEARTLAGEALVAQGERGAARAALEAAVSAAEQLREMSVGAAADRERAFESQVAPYRALTALAAESGDARDTLLQMERGRARLLVDQLASGQVPLALAEDERERERDLEERLVAAQAQLGNERARATPNATRVSALVAERDAARRAVEAFRTELLARRPELRLRSTGPPALDVDEIIRQAGAGTLFVEYALAGGSAWAVAVTLQDDRPLVRLAHLGKAVELAERSQQLVDAIARRDLRAAGLARELHGALLGPFEDLVARGRALVLAPDGALWNVPFPALVDGRGHALVERLPVSYSPSLAAWSAMRRLRTARAGSSRTLLAMGDPAAAGPRAPLSQTKSLLLGLHASLPGTRTLLGLEASEAAFKREAGGYDVLQIATHGALDDASPLYSHLRLAPGEGEDGRLEAREVLDLRLSADLAVLSACETARGRFGEGEGVLGLSWAFFMAGVPRVVVSHWKVEAASTTQLMLALHRHLRGRAGGPGPGVAEALQRAALELRRDPRYRHPFYWAAFAVLGDGG